MTRQHSKTDFQNHGSPGDPHGPMPEAAFRLAARFNRPSIAPVAVSLGMAAIDLVVFAVIVWFSFYAAAHPDSVQPVQKAFVATTAAACTVGALAFSGLYRIPKMIRPWRGAFVAALTLLATATIASQIIGAGTVAVAAALCIGTAVILPALRWMIAGFVNWCLSSGILERRAIVAGGGANAARLIRDLASVPGNDIRVCALFDDRADDRSPGAVLDVPKIGDFRDLVTFSRKAEIDMIIITLPLAAKERIAELMDSFKVLPVAIHLSNFSEDLSFRDPRSDIAPLIPVLPGSYLRERRLTKRAFDLTIGVVALIAFSPIMAMAALAIRLETKGPVFFKQRRSGFNERPIEILKFRSMRTDDCDPGARQIVTRGDPRVTRVGAVLRKTSIDELPQLLNVLAGDLSLVGPRPHVLDAVSSRQESFTEIVGDYSSRHRLPPGLTGWAQINGWRGEIDDPEKLRQRVVHDLWYIENWSLWLDLKILIKTPLALFDTRSAY